MTNSERKKKKKWDFFGYYSRLHGYFSKWVPGVLGSFSLVLSTQMVNRVLWEVAEREGGVRRKSFT